MKRFHKATFVSMNTMLPGTRTPAWSKSACSVYLRKPSGDGCCNSGRVVQEQRMTFQQALSGGVMQARWANGWGGSLVAGAHDMER